MKILKIIHGYPPNYNAGSEVYSQSVVNELKKENELFVFSREENEYRLDFDLRNEQKDNIHFTYVNMARGKDGYNHQLLNDRFDVYLKSIQPDVVHIGHLNHLSTGVIEVIKQQNIPIVYTLHDFWLMCPRGQFLQRNFDGNNLYNLCNKQENNKCANSCYKMYFKDELGENYYTSWVENRMKTTKKLVETIDYFIAPSKYLMNRFVDDFNIPTSKIEYLDYGFPLHYLKPTQKEGKAREFTFGYIGTHIPSKGLNILIQAFKQLKHPARLKIFGRELGQNTKALKLMAEDSLNPIEFCGEYINENLADVVFNKIDAIVVASIWGENSPLVIHEAQSCHIPVITANYGGMKEYVKHLENGLLFEHRNEDSLFKQMLFSVENQEKLKELGKRGYLYSRDGSVPNIQDHCNRLTEIYNTLIKENNDK